MVYPGGSVLGPVLFNIFTDDLEDGTEVPLAGLLVVCNWEGWPVYKRVVLPTIQRVLGSLEKWTARKLRQVSKEKCQVLHPGRKKPEYPGG